jgi:two-component system LytT family response regulator
VIGTANSVKEAEAIINEKKPELVFLDVEMPHGSGFDLLVQFPKKSFDVIFITAFNHYAIRAIKFSAVDYILKPININEFIEAVEKVIEKRTSVDERNENYGALLENIRSAMPSKLAIPTFDGMEYLNTKEIIRIEADRSYCWFYLADKRKILVSKNLKEYQELLNDRHFFRTHNSHLINLDYVKKYIRHEGGAVEMTDGSQVPISRTKRDLFLMHMSKLSK